jgi:hypothetical protein
MIDFREVACHHGCPSLGFDLVGLDAYHLINGTGPFRVRSRGGDDTLYFIFVLQGGCKIQSELSLCFVAAYVLGPAFDDSWTVSHSLSRSQVVYEDLSKSRQCRRCVFNVVLQDSGVNYCRRGRDARCGCSEPVPCVRFRSDDGVYPVVKYRLTPRLTKLLGPVPT